MNPATNVIPLNESIKIARGGLPDCPCLGIVDLYHEILPEAARVLILNQSRRAHLKARWREFAVVRGYKTAADGLAEWKRLFEYCRESKWLMSKVKPAAGRLPFELTLDFLLQPARFTDVVEGKYHRG